MRYCTATYSLVLYSNVFQHVQRVIHLLVGITSRTLLRRRPSIGLFVCALGYRRPMPGSRQAMRTTLNPKP